MLPVAHPSAASSVNATGTQLAACARCAPMKAKPSTAIPTPAARRAVSRSPSSSVASSIVKGACACSTSEARPGGIPASIAT